MKFYRFIAIAVLLSFTAFILGFSQGYYEPLYVLREEDLDMKQGTEMNFVSIAKNNMAVGMQLLFFGIPTFAVASLGLIFINGMIVGQLFNLAVSEHFIPEIIAGIMPHALPEILGFSLFLAASAIPGRLAFQYVHVQMLAKSDVIKGMKAMAILIVAGIMLIILAALIEEYVSFVL